MAFTGADGGVKTLDLLVDRLHTSLASTVAFTGADGVGSALSKPSEILGSAGAAAAAAEGV